MYILYYDIEKFDAQEVITTQKMVQSALVNQLDVNVLALPKGMELVYFETPNISKPITAVAYAHW